jgi:hypothetical protein
MVRKEKIMKVPRPVEKDVLDRFPGSSHVAEPGCILVPIYNENVYLTILMGAAIMKSGFAGVCKKRGRFPRKCFINPKTVNDLKETSTTHLEGMYVFANQIPATFIEECALHGHFYDTDIWITVVPDRGMEEGIIEFHC